ncbi:MAG: hypothetical protein NPIRA05_08440 [Nitrospirales bacterium]|nr:MAG: hypothetical protein NPIRA05_08440 [Nitrospirales bacterium]
MVADAMNLLRYEKIRRWESKDWWWAEDPQYDEVALGVSEGKRDREKQRALYVELCQNGEVAAIPEEVTVKQTNEEYERTRRIVSSVQNLLKNSLTPDWDYERVESCFRALFSNVNDFIDSQENEKT